MPFQIVVNPEPEPEAASKASKQAAEAQVKKESDRKPGKGEETEAKQPGALTSQHASTYLFLHEALCAVKAPRAESHWSHMTPKRCTCCNETFLNNTYHGASEAQDRLMGTYSC